MTARYITAESLRWHEVRGKVTRDLRGTPRGEQVRLWESERVGDVLSAGGTRRVIQVVRIMFCEQGWFAADGSPGRPDGAAECVTMLDYAQAGDLDGYARFHRQNPVLWKIVIEQGGKLTGSEFWCDSELPVESLSAGLVLSALPAV